MLKHNSIYYLGSNNGNNGATNADPGPANLCDGVTCAVANEECDPADGVCKCGGNESCEGKTNSPTCAGLIGACSCGSEPACTAGQTCSEGDGSCS